MNRTKTRENNTHIVIQVVRNFFSKMRQNPDIYPIRYYKKNRRFRRHWHDPIEK